MNADLPGPGGLVVGCPRFDIAAAAGRTSAEGVQLSNVLLVGAISLAGDVVSDMVLHLGWVAFISAVIAGGCAGMAFRLWHLRRASTAAARAIIRDAIQATPHHAMAEICHTHRFDAEPVCDGCIADLLNRADVQAAHRH